MKCNHEKTRRLDDVRGFMGSVAVHPYTDENPAAHGNITVTDECESCGAQRAVNINQWHYEYGPWGPSLAEREAAEEARQKAETAAQRAVEDKALASHRVRVVQFAPGVWPSGGQALIEIDGRTKWVQCDDIDEAAAQPDNGDGLVPLYRGVRRLIQRTIQESERLT